MVARVIPVDPFDLVVFGATGDLARRKILPGLFRRYLAGQIPTEGRIIGAARSDCDDAQFRVLVREAICEFTHECSKDDPAIDAFLDLLRYVPVEVGGSGGWKELSACLRDGVVRAFYLSVAPALYAPIAQGLEKAGLATEDSRIVVEKPFGHNLETARALNKSLRKVFEETQIYRIDHYLGKETVQNLMALRFGNALLEPVWNNQHIDHVQITVSETLGVGGRGEYYDHSGALRDMVQNHLMQLLCLIGMEPPSRFDPDAVRDEKLKVIRALEPVEAKDIVRGQYRKGPDGPSYHDDVNNAASRTESFVAMRVAISNWRWAGTPIYMRTGKRLRERVSEIALIFKNPPHSMFPNMDELQGNALIIRLQPDEGITLRMTIKDPGPGGMRLTEVPLDMSFADALGEDLVVPDAYERLVMDVIRGDQTLFMRGDELEAAWAWIDPIIETWEGTTEKAAPYDAGSSGPDEALELLHKDHRRWRRIGA